MPEHLPKALERIREAAERGLKHAQGGVFPIDRMEQCFKYIIHELEVYSGQRPKRH